MMDTRELAKSIRRTSLQMVHAANASHIGSALSISDIVAVLYGEILKTNPDQPEHPERDRFILSKGHACVAVYSALALMGFFPLEDLKNYAKDHSNLMTHISHKVRGVEFSTGSLGHGLPFGVGKSLAAKKSKQSWRTIVLMSDGEIAEGSNWEALLFAAHHRLENLTAIIDYNKLQSLTTVEKTLGIEPLAEKIKSFGWEVCEIDGHNHDALSKALRVSSTAADKPTMVIAHTIKGKGVSFMENSVDWHYKSPSAEQLKMALEESSHA
jgi:transketolase